jgi:hypothetical protein
MADEAWSCLQALLRCGRCSRCGVRGSYWPRLGSLLLVHRPGVATMGDAVAELPAGAAAMGDVVAGALAVEYAGVIGLAWDLCYWSIALPVASTISLPQPRHGVVYRAQNLTCWSVALAE